MILKLEYIPNKSIIITADIAVSQSAKIISIIKTGAIFYSSFFSNKKSPKFCLINNFEYTYCVILYTVKNDE